MFYLYLLLCFAYAVFVTETWFAKRNNDDSLTKFFFVLYMTAFAPVVFMLRTANTLSNSKN